MFGVEVLGDVVEWLREEHEKGQKATSAAVRSAGEELKGEWRRQVGSALSPRMGNAVRARHFPSQPSMNAASLVYAQPKAAPKVLDAFERGVTIRAKSGLWLAIPTDAAPKSRRGGRITPLEFERRTGQALRFVYRRGRSALLVAEGRETRRGGYAVSRSKTGRGLATVPIFVLVPQVSLRKRLDLFGPAERIVGRIPGGIVSMWR